MGHLAILVSHTTSIDPTLQAVNRLLTAGQELHALGNVTGNSDKPTVVACAMTESLLGLTGTLAAKPALIAYIAVRAIAGLAKYH